LKWVMPRKNSVSPDGPKLLLPFAAAFAVGAVFYAFFIQYTALSGLLRSGRRCPLQQKKLVYDSVLFAWGCVRSYTSITCFTVSWVYR